MAVDLEDLVPSLRRTVNPPGTELFPDATTGIMAGYLADAFWMGKLDGFFANYTEDPPDSGIIVPESGTDDLTREWQQLIVFFAAMQIIESELRSKNTLFRTKAGPVEYEVQNSAQLLREHLVTLNARRAYLLELLSNSYNIAPGYVDMVCARTARIIDGFGGYDAGSF